MMPPLVESGGMAVSSRGSSVILLSTEERGNKLYNHVRNCHLLLLLIDREQDILADLGVDGSDIGVGFGLDRRGLDTGLRMDRRSLRPVMLSLWKPVLA